MSSWPCGESVIRPVISVHYSQVCHADHPLAACSSSRPIIDRQLGGGQCDWWTMYNILHKCRHWPRDGEGDGRVQTTREESSVAATEFNQTDRQTREESSVAATELFQYLYLIIWYDWNWLKQSDKKKSSSSEPVSIKRCIQKGVCMNMPKLKCMQCAMKCYILIFPYKFTMQGI